MSLEMNKFDSSDIYCIKQRKEVLYLEKLLSEDERIKKAEGRQEIQILIIKMEKKI